MRISSALSEVLVFLCRLRRCRRTADFEMPRAEAITSFFKPLQQSVRTSISRRVSLRQRASDSIAPLANGGNRASLAELTRPRRGSLFWLGQSAHTPWKSAQKSRLSPIEVDVLSSPRDPDCPMEKAAPENESERGKFNMPRFLNLCRALRSFYRPTSEATTTLRVSLMSCSSTVFTVSRRVLRAG